MNLTSPTQVRGLLAELGIRPSRTLGQNFLVDANVLRILVEAARLTRDDRVLEVGPGLGVLTEALLARAGGVVAVEKDHRLAAHLADRFASDAALTIVTGDMLKQRFDVLGEGRLQKVVSNLPYRPGTRILVDLVQSPTPPGLIVVTVQREVADRLVATVGGEAYGLLGVWIGRLYDSELIKVVRPTCFWPPPAVTSAIMRLERHTRLTLPAAQEHCFYALTRHAFTQRRKQLASVLRKAPAGLQMADTDCRAWLTAQGLPAEARPQELSPEAWCRLSAEIGSAN
ncbi:MAG: ribosomal RNA small subunit methyltransferase A [Lentisphaerae bacterium]|nr:ribosomal RNA small subunit methyltransferase A [Lentisphaerota bacterium]